MLTSTCRERDGKVQKREISAEIISRRKSTTATEITKQKFFFTSLCWLAKMKTSA